MFVKGFHCILRGDIVEINQKGFTNNLRLVVEFDNQHDVLGRRLVSVDVDEKFLGAFNFKSNTYLEAEVELTEDNTTGYPDAKMIECLKVDDTTLKFPYYICPK